MQEMKFVAIHNFGGIGYDYYAKSSHLSLEHINNAHRQRFGEDFKSLLGYWVGYNFIIFPDGKIVQTRKIGEETAAQKGHNFDTVSIALAGNFSISFGTPVELPTKEQEGSLIRLIRRIKKRENVDILPGVNIDISLKSIIPHRQLQSGTECYGAALSNTWVKDIVVAAFQDEISMIQKLIFNLIAHLNEIMREKTSFGVASKPCWELDVRDIKVAEHKTGYE